MGLSDFIKKNKLKQEESKKRQYEQALKYIEQDKLLKEKQKEVDQRNAIINQAKSIKKERFNNSFTGKLLNAVLTPNPTQKTIKKIQYVQVKKRVKPRQVIQYVKPVKRGLIVQQTKRYMSPEDVMKDPLTKFDERQKQIERDPFRY